MKYYFFFLYFGGYVIFKELNKTLTLTGMKMVLTSTYILIVIIVGK